MHACGQTAEKNKPTEIIRTVFDLPLLLSALEFLVGVLTRSSFMRLGLRYHLVFGRC